MSGEKNEVKYIEDSIAREEAFAKGKAEVFEQADVLAKEHNAEVAVLLQSQNGQWSTYGGPDLYNVVKRYKDHSARASSSAEEAEILQARAKLDRVLDDLKQIKEKNKLLVEENLEEERNMFLEKRNLKMKKDQSWEEFVAFKKYLETLSENVDKRIQASLSLLENKNQKK